MGAYHGWTELGKPLHVLAHANFQFLKDFHRGLHLVRTVKSLLGLGAILQGSCLERLSSAVRSAAALVHVPLHHDGRGKTSLALLLLLRLQILQVAVSFDGASFTRLQPTTNASAVIALTFDFRVCVWVPRCASVAARASLRLLITFETACMRRLCDDSPACDVENGRRRHLLVALQVASSLCH